MGRRISDSAVIFDLRGTGEVEWFLLDIVRGEERSESFDWLSDFRLLFSLWRLLLPLHIALHVGFGHLDDLLRERFGDVSSDDGAIARVREDAHAVRHVLIETKHANLIRVAIREQVVEGGAAQEA
ncbi:hypothetical protein PENTCL1PPCAC_25432, partial [Pristionchus entomophagus]